ncbi:MAG: DUF1549 and DUF1553 domain-containing protein [Chthoniobacter sp.]|uniref:DUF1549 and DUF1553 domain-containing protein n=1 Tax=Chthoniobacter sp. TaxID=2510640 RepID=UPI0032A88DA6
MNRAIFHLCAFATLASLAAAEDSASLPWSFAAVKKPAVPAVKNTAWLKDGVDVFILARLEAAGLTPNPDADRATLLRRATFDLTGLPPAPEELSAFLRDPAPDDTAYAKVLDRLLASPRFGERWGRHWLDVVHYADSVGRTWNAPFIYAWRYRDWVIDSFNEDKPFTQFASEQIAGDLMPAKTVAEKRSHLTGTGFLTLGALPLPESGSEQFALDRVDDQIDVTTRSFLGLTMSCARCHNHKTDPIKQRDYYALAGIFYSTETLSGGQRGSYVDPGLLHRLPVDNTATTVAQRGATKPVAVAPDPMMMANPKSRISGGAMDAKGFYQTDPNLAMGVIEGSLRDCAIRIKGEVNQLGETPKRGELQLSGLPKLAAISEKASGRLELAQWIASPTNPLTARVAVNRVWLHLFGRGLVPTVDDFGLTGEKPTHPELLDHLAARFVEGGWSMKKLIRAIMLSRTYRESSAADPARLKIDGANALFWRMNPRRLELEAIRDAMLQASGQLNFERPAGIQVAGNGGKGKVAPTRALLDENATCRTVYLPVLRDLQPEIAKIFDFPEPTQIKGQREVTTVPAQALFFLNSRFAIDTARGAAQRLLDDMSLRTDDARLSHAYLTLLGREPAPDELKDARAFLAAFNDAPPGRWSALLQSLMAGTEFRYVW